VRVGWTAYPPEAFEWCSELCWPELLTEDFNFNLFDITPQTWWDSNMDSEPSVGISADYGAVAWSNVTRLAPNDRGLVFQTDISGAEQHQMVIDKLEELGLPLENPWMFSPTPMIPLPMPMP
jgi:hypothetical protein